MWHAPAPSSTIGGTARVTHLHNFRRRTVPSPTAGDGRVRCRLQRRPQAPDGTASFIEQHRRFQLERLARLMEQEGIGQ